MVRFSDNLSIIKQRYREIFAQACEGLYRQFQPLAVGCLCAECGPLEWTDPETILFQTYHSGCPYRGWQADVVKCIEQTVARQILEAMHEMETSRGAFACQQTGNCCRLASSEFNYETLLEKARQGDWFAQQFTSVFLPYNSLEAAQTAVPKLVAEVLQTVTDPTDVYFYHCPQLVEDTNLCGLWEDPRRPKICATYPENPLTLIYSRCGYRPWKEQAHGSALWAHAMVELCTYMLGKLNAALGRLPDAAL